MSVALVSRSKLAHNMSVLQRAAGRGVLLFPAVKANAYGHGSFLVSSVLSSLGFSCVCVAQVHEAAGLAPGVSRVLVLGGMTLEEAPLYRPPIISGSSSPSSPSLEAVVSSAAQIAALSASSLRGRARVGVHVKVDTGMSRQGCLPHELPQLLQAVSDNREHLVLRGVMSHFAAADDSDRKLTETQLTRFRNALQGITLPQGVMRHIANSAGILGYPSSLFEAARPGIAIYGLNPGDGVSAAASQLKPILELQTRVTLLKTVEAGTGVSYGHHFTTLRPKTVLATLSIGYGDGISRAQSNRMRVIINGVSCPQLGRVTMDQIVVDATDVPNLKVGAVAIVIGSHPSVTADALAQQASTINYEILTGLSARVQRNLVD